MFILLHIRCLFQVLACIRTSAYFAIHLQVFTVRVFCILFMQLQVFTVHTFLEFSAIQLQVITIGLYKFPDILCCTLTTVHNA